MVLWFWRSKRLAPWRFGCILAIAALAIAGLTRFHTDDDVRRMQALSPDLLAQQARLQALIGHEGGGQFFLVPARDAETALQRQEALAERLRPLVADGALSGFRSPAQYVPSAQRQQDNRSMRERELGRDARQEQFRRLGLPAPESTPDTATPVLTMAEAMGPDSPLSFLSLLVLDDGQAKGGQREGGQREALHVVMLDGVRRLEAVAAAGEGIAGVQYVDTTASFSAMLGQYRGRAIMLLALSAALMAPLLGWRYGVRRACWIMLPPLLALVATPGLRALFGAGFSLFDAIGLVLILSIGVDYAVFLAETSRERRAVTMLAVALAALTALLSFGLLALSHVQAVRHFGATMSIGILLAVLLAPLARRS